MEDDWFIEDLRKWMLDNPLDVPLQYDSEISKAEALKRNAEIVECDRCGVKGNRPNMLRWHFEKCEVVMRSCKHCGKTIPRQGIKNHLYDQKIYCDRHCYMKSKIGKAPIIMTEEVKDKLAISAKKTSKERSDRMKSNKVWMKSGRWITK